MTTHAVARDADTGWVEFLERGKHRPRQFLRYVAVHVVSLVVRGLGGIDVEAGSGAKVPRIILAFDVQAA